MKRGLLILCVLCLAAALLFSALGSAKPARASEELSRSSGPWEHGADGPCPGAVFTDMPAYGKWSHQPIDWAVSKGITSGVSDTRFAPGTGCTRAQVVTFLWRAAGEPAAPSGLKLRFTDVKTGSFYYEAVRWAVYKGITKGTDDPHFSPGSTCTRAQIVTFLHRFEGSPLPDPSVIVSPEDMDPNPDYGNPFSDVKTTAYYFIPVVWAVNRGVTNGTSPTTFSPNNTCTRAEVVTFLFRDREP